MTGALHYLGARAAGVPSRVLAVLLPGFVARIPDGSRPGHPKLYLTFDDGPTRGHTEALLQTLERYRAKATFFLTTSNAAHQAPLTRAIASAGHAIATHGHSHGDPWRRSMKDLDDDLQMSIETIREITGTEPQWYRPPYGHVRPSILQLADRLGLAVAGWDVMPGDFGAFASRERVVRTTVRSVRPGSIVVLHDNAEVASTGVTRAALDTILDTLGDQGWRFSALPTS